MSRGCLSCALLLSALLAGCGGGGASPSSPSGGGGTTTSTASSTGGQGGTAGAGGEGGETFRIALSVSPFTGTLFDAGVTLTDGALSASNTEELESLYLAHGANELYARISTERKKTAAPDDHSMQTALAKAALAKQLGVPFNPELGLWKHYGDIGCSPAPDFSEYPEINVPGPWETLAIEQMLPPLHDYGVAAATEILATGATVDYWDLGNEIDLGTAGVAPEGFNCVEPYVAPDGVDPEIGAQTVLGLLTLSEAERIAWLTAHIWPREAKILAAVQEGIRSVDPKARFSTHMSQSLSDTFAVAFYQAMADGGFTVDRIGFSYYPTASAGPLRAQKFKDTALAVQAHFGKPAYVGELGYPAAPLTTGPYKDWNNLIPKYPMSEDGQAAFFRDFTSWAVASGLAGVRPWAPEVIAPGWDGFALFDAKGGNPVPARKALSSVAEGAAAPDAAAFADQ